MKYRTIYADPPWRLQSMSAGSWKADSSLESKYPTMTTEEIKALPVNDLADESCSLFLWCTHSTLIDALDVLRAWGFKYHVAITWDKMGGFSLWGFHRRTEMLLYAYRGKINVNQKGKYIPTLISELKTRHSSKPIAMYEILESNTPPPRLEMFARIRRPGWDTWGNEIANDIEITQVTPKES